MAGATGRGAPAGSASGKASIVEVIGGEVRRARSWMHCAALVAHCSRCVLQRKQLCLTVSPLIYLLYCLSCWLPPWVVHSCASCQLPLSPLNGAYRNELPDLLAAPALLLLLLLLLLLSNDVQAHTTAVKRPAGAGGTGPAAKRQAVECGGGGGTSLPGAPGMGQLQQEEVMAAPAASVGQQQQQQQWVALKGGTVGSERLEACGGLRSQAHMRVHMQCPHPPSLPLCCPTQAVAFPDAPLDERPALVSRRQACCTSRRPRCRCSSGACLQ